MQSSILENGFLSWFSLCKLSNVLVAKCIKGSEDLVFFLISTNVLTRLITHNHHISY